MFIHRFCVNEWTYSNGIQTWSSWTSQACWWIIVCIFINGVLRTLRIAEILMHRALHLYALIFREFNWQPIKLFLKGRHCFLGGYASHGGIGHDHCKKGQTLEAMLQITSTNKQHFLKRNFLPSSRLAVMNIIHYYQ